MTELRADPLHPGVRVATLVAWFVIIFLIYLAGYYLVRALWGAEAAGYVWVLVVAAMFFSQPLARFTEHTLIQRWPSGRAVRLAPGALVMQEKHSSHAFDLTHGHFNYWRWYFVVKNRRSGRITNGDYCMAVRFVQGEEAATLYTFVPKKQAAEFVARYACYELQRSADPRKAALSGRDAIYLAAEQARWETGAELSVADFEALLAHLAAHLPTFKTTPSS